MKLALPKCRRRRHRSRTISARAPVGYALKAESGTVFPWLSLSNPEQIPGSRPPLAGAVRPGKSGVPPAGRPGRLTPISGAGLFGTNEIFSLLKKGKNGRGSRTRLIEDESGDVSSFLQIVCSFLSNGLVAILPLLILVWRT